ncbi:sodium:proton antiporter [Microbacterium sp.]|uniref:sodium:proton antiporter n=1 Tax=Microbacterium sp. TaxID=51671 RepID=UPI00333E8A04
MAVFLIVGFLAIALWSLVSHRLTRWGMAGSIGLAVLGAVSVVTDVDGFGTAINAPSSLRVVGLVLAVLLFVDATDVRGDMFGGEGRALARLVFLALPLSLVLAVLVGAWLLPGTGILALLVMACVIMPIDFSPAGRVLRSHWVPARVRRILNVESGYGDGFVSPLFSMALALAVFADTLSHVDTEAIPDATLDSLAGSAEKFLVAFLGAIPATLLALVIGGALGTVMGFLVRKARDHGWADAAGARFVMLLLPLIAYGASSLSPLGTSGFVAAFVAGVAFRVARTQGMEVRAIPREELVLVEEVGEVASHVVWFVLGAAAVLMVAEGVDGRVVLFAALALTVLRILPVIIGLFRSDVPVAHRVVIGAMGPRGTASIVFGLLAYNALPDRISFLALSLMVATVVGSILVHGVVAPLVLSRAAVSSRLAAVPERLRR